MKHKILIIDDEEMILTMMKKCLEAENFLVYTANNAKKSIRAYVCCARYYPIGYKYA